MSSLDIDGSNVSDNLARFTFPAESESVELSSVVDASDPIWVDFAYVALGAIAALVGVVVGAWAANL